MSAGEAGVGGPEHFDTLVVGSGFGGSVVAYELASAGRQVCLFERGRAWPPGSFPRSPRELAQGLWDPRTSRYGMFDVWSFRKLEALVSSGLGGGSLIYANVLIRKDPAWFVTESQGQPGYESWPIGYDDLEEHYGACEAMLGATPYPFAHAPYDQTPKTLAMRDAAQRRRLDWDLPNLAVTFAADPQLPPVPGESIREPEPNLHRSERQTCRLCGECDVGCNYGSKNTLDFNYLSRAADAGAEIRTLTEVRRIERHDRGFAVTYVQHDPDAHPPGTDIPRTSRPERVVTTRRLVLGAGALGSTYLLLRNRAGLHGLSPALGTRFSGNGDLLTFLRGARLGGSDGGSGPRWLDPSQGPVITSRLRFGDSLDGDGSRGRGFYIEDGGHPTFLSWLTELSGLGGTTWRLGRFVLARVADRLRDSARSNLSGEVADLLGRGARAGTSLPLLTMGRDVPDGNLTLRRGQLDLDWTWRGSRQYLDRAQEELEGLADAVGARLAHAPLWLFKRLITVHPLGGCPMADDQSRGVVDAYGQAFGVPGLYVVDGAAMPGPVGPNPSLTIAAFARRAAQAMLE